MGLFGSLLYIFLDNKVRDVLVLMRSFVLRLFIFEFIKIFVFLYKLFVFIFFLEFF